MRKSPLTTILACAVGLLACQSAHAVQFTLNSSLASLIDPGNTNSVFFEVDGTTLAETGTVANLYSATLGGNANNGFFVAISFGGNPQPVLNSAFLKTANGYLLWDAADFTAFNAGTFDSIKLWNSGTDGITNNKGKYQETSHAGLNGSLGLTTNGNHVPDGGATVALFGLSLLGMTAVRKAIGQAKA